MMLSTTHYYGDLVRKLFLAGGLLMLISLPFFQFFVPVSMFVAIIAILVIILGAALIVPTQRWTMVVDMLVAGLAMLSFEYYATIAYGQNQIWYFVTNQVLALIFFVAFYFAIKTVRGAYSGEK